MECQICIVLEAIRRDRITRFSRLLKDLKKSPSKAELIRSIDAIQGELNEVWRRLAVHRGEHIDSDTANTAGKERG